MNDMYWFDTCHHCGQGRLFVFWSSTKSMPYLHCEECEWGWYDPENLEVEAGFLTLDEEFESRPATDEEIDLAGWRTYARTKT